MLDVQQFQATPFGAIEKCSDISRPRLRDRTGLEQGIPARSRSLPGGLPRRSASNR
jgi:hypothetical protein